MTTRRAFLGSLLASAALPRLGWADAGDPAFLAAAREGDGGHALFGLTETGQDLFRVPLPARGHAGAAHPTAPEAVAFARRPGTYALVLNCVTGGVTARLAAPPGREFNGHGVFSETGDILFTSEVVAETGAGRIGLWARHDGYARIGEIETAGIGPHEIRRLPGSDTLVVANGGIRTGAGDREKLNLDSMRPNLAYLSATGDVLDLVQLPNVHHHASIRHLSLAPDGLVAFAMQWEGVAAASPALLGLHRPGAGAPVLARAPGTAHAAMQGYAGSVTFFDNGRLVAISSPRGGRVQAFDAAGAFVFEILRDDVCGLAARGDRLILTDGFGTFLATRGGLPETHLRTDRAWDNHIVTL